MSQELLSKFYTILSLPLHEKLNELTKIIDQSSPTKELQNLFLQLINNIFLTSQYNNGWGLKTITFESNHHEFMLLMSFLEPQGPLFRLCYKLLSDPLLKYNLTLDMLPQNLQFILERGRYPQFYADMIHTDPQAMNVVALALNPFDYYIFNFALHLVNNNQNKSSWESWNSVYFALACDYLMHFLPADPNISVTPLIPNYTGKVLMAAPLQTANRPLGMPSLLLLPDVPSINNQHTSPQTDSRNEVWRSETILQVFVDIWMSVDDYSSLNMNLFNRNFHSVSLSPERVRAVRVLVKHIHTYSAKHMADLATRSSSLRKYARQILCARAYHYVKHLVTTWPLDASFRLVMELWLSLIQPWRYTDGSINQDRYPNSNHNQEEGSIGAFDASYTQFIAENFPSYTCILQMVLPRFMRLDLTVYKNAVMLFRLGKVFSQPQLVPILRELEKFVTNSNDSYYNGSEYTWNNNGFDQSNSNVNVSTSKWGSVAKQAIADLNLSVDFKYEPIWSDHNRPFVTDFVQNIVTAHSTAEKIVEENVMRLNKLNEGVWASIKHWFMIGVSYEDEAILEESKKVPTYLTNSIQQFTQIFGLTDSILIPTSVSNNESGLDHSSFANSSRFPHSITDKLRSTPTNVSYMGDPDLIPIASYESVILVRILYQISSRLNEVYREEFSNLWNRNDFWGVLSREVLQKPMTIHTYVKDKYNRQSIVSEELPARLSLRRLGSNSIIVWTILGYILFRFLSYSGWFYLFFIIIMWSLNTLSKATCKYLGIVKM